MGESLRWLFGQDRQDFWAQTIRYKDQIREIRLRVGRPVLIRRPESDCYLDEKGGFTEWEKEAYRLGQQEMDTFFMRLCHDSPYAFEDMLRQGFLTAPGGHRIGFAGQAVLEEDKSIRTLKHIYYINIRVAHQVFGVAEGVLPFVYREGEPRNLLIVSPPGCGKTTLLRELIRRISDGNIYGRGRNVGVVDERSELAGSYLGIPQNDLGTRTDVLDGCPKAQGMFLLLRSMAPEVLAVDELGDGAEAEALREAAACGCKVVATAHGADLEDVETRFLGRVWLSLFDLIILLDKRHGGALITRIYQRKKLEGEYADAWRGNDSGRLSGTWTMVSEQVHRTDQSPAYFGSDSGAFQE